MLIQIGPERLQGAKRAFTTRNVPCAALTKIAQAGVVPRAGDVVLARVLSIGAHRHLELPTSRKATLFEGDEVILAFGNRYAPDQFEAYVPDTLAPCDLAAAGGVAGAVINSNDKMALPTRIEPIGIFVGETGAAMNLSAFALMPVNVDQRRPGIAVVGGSMNAGKTTTAAALIHGLTRAGLRVGAAKLTGTGAGNDFWHMRDAGAIAVLDFTDAGLATTYKASRADIERGARTLSAALIERGAEIIVYEIADGIYQEETSWLIAAPVMRDLAQGYLYAGESAASSAAGVHWLRQRANVLAVSGLVSTSPLARREAEAATGLVCLAKSDLIQPETALQLLSNLSGAIPKAA